MCVDSLWNRDGGVWEERRVKMETMLRLGPSGGTRSAATIRDARITELELRVQQLAGKSNRSERNRLNKELFALHAARDGMQLPSAERSDHETRTVSSNGGAVAEVDTESACEMHMWQRIAEHWQICNPHAPPSLMSHCVRCGDGTGPTCKFHPDAKAFALGTGRFDYGFTSAYDTPHDFWFCCGGAAPGCVGCCEEPTHTIDPEWWRTYAEDAPQLDGSDDTDDSDDSDETCNSGIDATDRRVPFVSDAIEAMAAMEID